MKRITLTLAILLLALLWVPALAASDNPFAAPLPQMSKPLPSNVMLIGNLPVRSGPVEDCDTCMEECTAETCPSSLPAWCWIDCMNFCRFLCRDAPE